VSIRSRVERVESHVAVGESELCKDEWCAMREVYRAIEGDYGTAPGTPEAADHPPSLCREFGERLEKAFSVGGASCQ
jgi:hypothetical protein